MKTIFIYLVTPSLGIKGEGIKVAAENKEQALDIFFKAYPEASCKDDYVTSFVEEVLA